MSKISVGIIGLGGVGSTVLRAFEAHPETRIAAVCDRDPNRLEAFAPAGSGIAAFGDYRLLLEREQVDLIYLAVPPKYHHAIALEIVKSGRHLLCEKPLANSLAEAEEMLASAEAAGVVHAMNFPTYYRPAHRALAKLLQEGRLGELRRIEIKVRFPEWPRPWQRNDWISTREQGGFVREVVPHFVHLIQHHYGAVTRIHSRIDYPERPEACETGLAAIAQLASPSRVPILIDGLSQAVVDEEASLAFYGSRASVKLLNWSRLLLDEGDGVSDVFLKQHDHLLELVDQVVRAVRGLDNETVTFRAGVEVQRTLEALLSGSEQSAQRMTAS